jgi:exopolysaccharide production protein ExoZ
VINNLQFLRAVAAFAVVWAHLKAIFPLDAVPSALPSGLFGVDLFFVISGFIMLHTTDTAQTTARNFFIHRLIRVAPTYYLMTIFVILIAIIAPKFLSSTAIDFGAVLKSFLFIPYEKTADRIYPIFYLGWTLNYEMFFYIIFTVALYINRQQRFYLAAATIAGLILIGYISGVTPEYSVTLFALTRPIMADFLLGMAIAYFYMRMPSVRKIPSTLFLLAVIVGAALLLVLRLDPTAVQPATNTFFKYGLASALIVLGMVGLEIRGIRIQNPVALLLGNASYSLYLTHFFVVAVFITVANKLNLSLTGRIFLCALAFVAVAICAIGFYRLVEAPIGRQLRRIAPMRQPIVAEKKNAAA